MKINYISDPFPHAIIKEFYTNDELNLIWDELNFLAKRGKLLGPENTVSARNEDGTYKKRNSGLFLYDVYKNPSISDIITLSRKVFDKHFCDILSKYNYIFDYIYASSRDSILLNYYENGDFYESHKDKSCITAITTLFKEPRCFEGGLLTFTDFDYSVDLNNNCMIIFQGIISHEVSEVKTKNTNFGTGRFSIVNFMDFAG